MLPTILNPGNGVSHSVLVIGNFTRCCAGAPAENPVTASSAANRYLPLITSSLQLQYFCLAHDRLRLLADLARNFIRIALLEFRKEKFHRKRTRVTLIRELP